jgi:FkbM family methyltransferase
MAGDNRPIVHNVDAPAHAERHGSLEVGFRAMAASNPVRRFLTRPAVERVVATALRSSTVRERIRFVLRELGGRRGLVGYRLRSSGLTAYLRHGTGDIVTLDEVFYSREYELPPNVERGLAGLDRPPRVVDLGANIGLFGLSVRERFPGAELIAVEADPDNARVLRLCAATNDIGGRWQVIEGAASNRDGERRFQAGRFALSRLSDGDEGDLVRSIDVFPQLAQADLVKIDIEGGEWDLFADSRLAEVSAALVVEYHPYLCPEDDPHGTAERLLAEAGYTTRPAARRDDGHGILWAWR